MVGIAVISLSLLVTADAGSTPRASGIDGAIRGKPFLVRSANSTVVTGGAGGSLGEVILSDDPDDCRLWSQHAVRKGMRRLVLQLSDNWENASGTEPEDTGTYPIAAKKGSVASAWYTEYGDACHEAVHLDVVSGKVDLTENHYGYKGGSFYAGTFTLVLRNGDRIQGRFYAPNCKALSEYKDPQKALAPMSCR